MKHNEIKGVSKIPTIDLENIFNVFTDDVMLNDQYYYNITKTVTIPEDLDETNYDLYNVNEGDTWTNLSYRFYGQVEGWWLICKANNISNPIEFPKGGTKLKILKRNVARQILTVINQ